MPVPFKKHFRTCITKNYEKPLTYNAHCVANLKMFKVTKKTYLVITLKAATPQKQVLYSNCTTNNNLLFLFEQFNSENVIHREKSASSAVGLPTFHRQCYFE